jgi:hypothetical protein
VGCGGNRQHRKGDDPDLYSVRHGATSSISSYLGVASGAAAMSARTSRAVQRREVSAGMAIVYSVLGEWGNDPWHRVVMAEARAKLAASLKDGILESCVEATTAGPACLGTRVTPPRADGAKLHLRRVQIPMSTRSRR